MTQNIVQVPENVISLLNGHIGNQDDDFLRGFCSLLTYQYPDSKFTQFYDNYGAGDLSVYLTELVNYLNSGGSALTLPEPVQGKVTYTHDDIDDCIHSINQLNNQYHQRLFVLLSSEDLIELTGLENQLLVLREKLHSLRSL